VLDDFDRFKVMLAKIKVRNLPIKCLVPVGTVYIVRSHFFYIKSCSDWVVKEQVLDH
jgi:hypothetical protein